MLIGLSALMVSQLKYLKHPREFRFLNLSKSAKPVKCGGERSDSFCNSDYQEQTVDLRDKL